MDRTSALDRIRNAARTGYGVGRTVAGQAGTGRPSASPRQRGGRSRGTSNGDGRARRSAAPRTPARAPSTPVPAARPRPPRRPDAAVTSDVDATGGDPRARRPPTWPRVAAQKPRRRRRPPPRPRRSPRRSRCPAPSCRPASRPSDADGIVREPARPGPGRPGRRVRARASPRGPRPATAARRSSPRTRCAAWSAAVRTTSTPRPTRSPCSRPIVAARLGRGLTTVVDTLGLDAGRRRGWLAAGAARRPAGGGGRLRDPRRRVPAPQRRARPAGPGPGAGRPAASGCAPCADELAAEGWDVVHEVARAGSCA